MNLALAGTDEGLWDWDVVNGSVRYDDNWTRILGYAPGEKEFDFKWWSSQISPDSRQVFEKALNDYLGGKEKYYEMEYQIRDASDKWRWIWGRGVCVSYDEDGKPLRIIGTHRDITERRQAKEALREKTILLNSLVEALPDIVHIKDSSRRYLMVNNAHNEFSGLSKHEVVGKTIEEVLPALAEQSRHTDEQIIRNA